MRLWTENKRFAVVPAGRRSGKTELAKRKLICLLSVKKNWDDPRYFAAAPTKDQAKRIFWSDLKAFLPKSWRKKIYETDLCIKTVFGSELWVIGLDKPQRIEGTAWDGGVLDEYANMRPSAWTFITLAVFIWTVMAPYAGFSEMPLTEIHKDIMQTVIIFYFGGRSIEKAAGILRGR